MADETVEESVAETRGDEVADLGGERTEDSIADEPEAPAETGPSRGKLFAAAVGARIVAFGRAWMRTATRQGAALIAGLALCASFPPWGFWWAAFPALSVLGLVLWSPRTTLRGGLGYGLLFGLAFFIPLLPWTGQLVGAVPWLALSLLCALWVALFGLLAVAVRNLPGWPLWFAAAWSATEWGKASIPFGGFPWGRVAFGQGDSPMLGLARYGGAPLVSFAVALGAFAVTALGIEMYRWWRSPSVGPDGARPMPSVLLPGVCVCLVLFAMAISWQQVRHASHGATDGRTVTVAAVQGNVPRLGLDFNAQRRAVLDYHVKETVLLAQDVKAGKAPAPQFVVWPENSSDIDPIRNADAAEAINEAAQAIGVPILVGGVLRHPDSTPNNRSRSTRSSCGTRTPAPANVMTSRSCSRSVSICRGAASSRTSPSTPIAPDTSCLGTATVSSLPAASTSVSPRAGRCSSTGRCANPHSTVPRFSRYRATMPCSAAR